MVSQFQLNVVAGLGALLWAGLLLAYGVRVDTDFFKPFSAVVATLAIAIAAFDRWLWRWKRLHPWPVATPDLQGTWRGHLESDWTDPSTGEKIPPIEVYLVIRQTHSSIDVRLMTPESRSHSLSAKIVHDTADSWQVAVIYRNEPDLLRRQTSPMHLGGLRLHAWGNPPDGLRGEYWTDRGTRGEIQFSGKTARAFNDYEAAAAGDYH